MATRKSADELREEGEKKLTLVDKVVNDMIQPAMIPLMEKGYVPDMVMRVGIRKLLDSTLNMCRFDGDVEKQTEYLNAFVEDLKSRSIAEQTHAANEQHYEVPAEFYKLMMGPYLKYSSGYWPNKDTTLEESEEAMLTMFCERAGLDTLETGSTVLDVGCGWGSLSLFAAKKYPQLEFTGISNSNSQREFITSQAEQLGLKNVTIKTVDINKAEFAPETFDRVMSVEMMEHCKNYEKLFENIATWMKPKGKMMVHIFVHKQFSYHFQDGWMSETFFSGGTMPGKDLFLRFNKDLRVVRQWSVNGTHYSRTLEAWLTKMDSNKEAILKIFEEGYGKDEMIKQFNNWRVFCMACSELFRWKDGNEWFVEHYLFEKV